MESMILQGASASGMYLGRPGIYMNVESIHFSVPQSGTLTAASVTLSGAYGTKNYTFSNDIEQISLPFAPNENVYVSTSNFGAAYGVVINYTQGGDMSSYMQTDYTRSGVFGVPNFWRYRT
jgi:hypothetical protein